MAFISMNSNILVTYLHTYPRAIYEHNVLYYLFHFSMYEHIYIYLFIMYQKMTQKRRNTCMIAGTCILGVVYLLGIKKKQKSMYNCS